MAKDDYDVLVFRVLTYLYACLKRVTVFEEREFAVATGLDKVAEAYFWEVLRMMTQEGYITGFAYVTAWGRELIPLSGFSDLKISSEGIHYLKNNSSMHKVKEFLVESKDVIVSLLTLLQMR